MYRATAIQQTKHSGYRSNEYGRSVLSNPEQLPSNNIPSQSAAEQVEILAREFESLRQDLLEAAQVQRRLNGPRELRRGSYEIACETFPVRYISGDFCTVFDVGHRTVFALGDIAGKGLTAGMWFTQVVSTVRIHAASKSDPAEAMTAINRDLCG